METEKTESARTEAHPADYSSQTPMASAPKNAPPLTMGDFLVMFIVFSLPLVNLIMAFVWGFGSEVNPNRQNYAKAWLVIMLIMFVLGILAAIVGGLAARTLAPIIQDLF